MTAQTKRPFSLSVFFPCHNEEGNVERVTLQALQACQRHTDDFEVLIINDGSRDRTREIADRLAKTHPQVRAIHNEVNLGYGGALQRGFREARKDYVFYTDGDAQFDLSEIDKVLALKNQYDIVSGFRLDRKDPFIRKVNAFCWGTLVRMLFGMSVRDIDCAFKLYPRRLFDEIEMRSTGALIDTEILARATRRGYSIGQVGVHHYPRTEGTQTGANLRVILRAFSELFQLYRHISESGNPRTHEAERVPSV